MSKKTTIPTTTTQSATTAMAAAAASVASSMSAINVLIYQIGNNNINETSPPPPPPSLTNLIPTTPSKTKSKSYTLWQTSPQPDLGHHHHQHDTTTATTTTTTTTPSFTVGPISNNGLISNTTSPTRLKIPFKLKPSSSRSGSFKVKKKTKRSKSAPINQRKILVNSTFYTLLSTNYGDTLLSGSGGNGQLFSPKNDRSASNTSGMLMMPGMCCVFCDQKRPSHIFT